MDTMLDTYISPMLIPAILLASSIKYHHDLSTLYKISTTGSIMSTMTLLMIIYISKWNHYIKSRVPNNWIKYLAVFGLLLLCTSYFSYFINLILRSPKFELHHIISEFQSDLHRLLLGKISGLLRTTVFLVLQRLVCPLVFYKLYTNKLGGRHFEFGESFILSQLASLVTLLWMSTISSAIFTIDQSDQIYETRTKNDELNLETKILINCAIILISAVMLMVLIDRLRLPRKLKLLINYNILTISLLVAYIRADSILKKSNPVQWFLAYVVYESHHRLSLCIFWTWSLIGGIAFAIIWSQNTTCYNPMLKKIYHIMLSIIFISGYNDDLEFLSFVAGSSLLFLIFLEFIRVVELRPHSLHLNLIFQVFESNSNNRQSNLTMDGIYLTLSIFLPVWLLPTGQHNNKLTVSSGMMAVGICDPFTAIICKLFGRHRIPGYEDKSYEGVIGGLLANVIVKLLWIGWSSSIMEELSFFLVCLCTSLTGLCTTYNNLLLSLIMTLINILLNHPIDDYQLVPS